MTEQTRIPEDIVPGKRLGRHVRHDPRSLSYPFKAAITLSSHRWSQPGDQILDQGDLGSCTGNATVGALICSANNPLHNALTSTQTTGLNEDLAVRVYSRATETDPFQGTYRPDDTGSDGLDAGKAAREFGYISGFSHALSLNDALAALTFSPIIIGINWYAGMDEPAASGLVAPTGSVRGGHEICLDEIDVSNNVVWFRNSWTTGWGVRGRAFMTFASLGSLLSNDGDATVLTPLSVPAPTPVPTPPTVSDDQKLADDTRAWSAARHTGTNKAAAISVNAWRKAKGL